MLKRQASVFFFSVQLGEGAIRTAFGNSDGPEIQKPLLDQLKVNGVLVLLLGGASLFQTFLRLTNAERQINQENLGEVAFLPIAGEYGTQ